MICPETKMLYVSKLSYSLEPYEHEVVVRKGKRIVCTIPLDMVTSLMTAWRIEFDEAVEYNFKMWFGDRLCWKYPAFVEGLAVEL